MTATEVPALGVPASPPLPADLDAVLRRLRLLSIRCSEGQSYWLWEPAAA